MKTRLAYHRLTVLLSAAVLSAAGQLASAQTTAFTYQGRLNDGAGPAAGLYDFEFRVFDAATNGASLATPNDQLLIGVTNGMFTVTLDFGSAVFTGPPRWLELAVRPSLTAVAFTNLAPRQAITPQPYALYSANAGTAFSLASFANQTFAGQVAFSPSSGGAPFRVNTALVVTNLNADLVDGQSASAFWNLGGNANSVSANFLGTLDAQPLELRANNVRALRLEGNAFLPNVIGGAAGNSVTGGAAGATIAGGGPGNSVSANFGTVGGGTNNSVTGFAATIPGGSANLAAGQNSFAAGNNARAAHNNSFVWSDASSFLPFASSAANQFLIRAAGGVGIGVTNPASLLQVGGTIQAAGFKMINGAAVGYVLTSDTNGVGTWQPGPIRVLSGSSPSVVGGYSGNAVAGGAIGATISGGGSVTDPNIVNGDFGTVAGGRNNQAGVGMDATVSGGYSNRAFGTFAVVSGGGGNVASGWAATVAGGVVNTASNTAAVVGGGVGNVASGYAATIPGGLGNTAAGNYSFAAGARASAAHNGSFVWADSSSVNPLASTAANQFVVRAAGGIGIGGPPGGDALLDVQGAARLNNNDLFLREGTNRASGLAYYGSNAIVNKTFASVNVDGPVLYGAGGGALGSRASGSETIALSWKTNGFVGLGTSSPNSPLHVYNPLTTVANFESADPGGTAIALANAKSLPWFMYLTGGDGSGIFGPPDTQGDFRFSQLNQPRLTLRSGGNVGIGTTVPGELLELAAANPTLRLHNVNDENVGGFVENTFHSLLFGLYNMGDIHFDYDDPEAPAVPVGTKQTFFGIHGDGAVGSLNQTPGSPSFRNLLDDGQGNMHASSSISFGADANNIGADNNGLQFKSAGEFSWYLPNSTFNPDMRLDSSGNLHISGAQYQTSDRNRKEKFAALSTRSILEKVAALPIQSWNYKQDTAVRHIGPVAQDFHAAFGVGPDDKCIATVDESGVALAAIQGLNQIVREKDARILALEQQLAAISDEVAAQSDQAKKWETRLGLLEKDLNALTAAPARQTMPKSGGAQ